MERYEVDFDHLLQLLQMARALEGGGFYNAAKVCRALAESEMTRASQLLDGQPGNASLGDDLAALIDDLTARGEKPRLIAMLEAGRQAIADDDVIPWGDAPEVAVCRVCGELVLGGSAMRCPACGVPAITFHSVPATYYLEELPPERVLTSLVAMPADLDELLHGLNDEQLAARPEPEGWSLRDALWHLLQAQAVFDSRVALMLAEETPRLEAAAVWAAQDKDDLSVRDVLTRFHESRRETIARLAGLSLEDWQRTGLHTEFGPVTVLQQASYFAKHERAHQPQIEALRDAQWA